MNRRNVPLIYACLAALLVLSACRSELDTSPTTAAEAPALSIRPTRPPNTIATATAVAPDGTVWYAFDEFDSMGGAFPYSQNRGLYRSTDNVISHYEITGTIRVLKLAPDGSLYVGAGCGVLRFNADRWETLANPDCEHTAFTKPVFPFDIAFADNGDVWVSGVHALARFDGTQWAEYDILARRALVAPDGSLWADGWNGIANSDCCFTHLTGDTWVTYTHSADLPVTADLARSIHGLRQ